MKRLKVDLSKNTYRDYGYFDLIPTLQLNVMDGMDNQLLDLNFSWLGIGVFVSFKLYRKE